MNDQQVTEMIGAAALPTDEEVAAWDIERELGELLADIATGHAAPERAAPGRARRPTPSRLALAGGIVAGALAAVIAFVGDGGGGGPTEAYAQEAVRVAQANPRILVGEPGWRVESVGGFEPEEGDLVFARDGERIGLDWRPAAGYESYTRQLADLSVRETEVLGAPARTYGEDGRYRTVIPPTESVYVEIYPMTVRWSQERWQRFLGSLERVDLETWLGAMPPEVVLPDEAGGNLATLLEGVPVPPGFRAEQIDSRQLSGGERRVAATVTYAVTCAWFDEWAAAKRSGDAGAASAAVEALQGYGSWSTREHYTDGSVAALGDLMADSEPRDISESYVDQQLNCVEYR